MKVFLQLLAFILISTITTSTLHAQHKEIGARVVSLDRLDFMYKKKKSETQYHRYRLYSGGLTILAGNVDGGQVNFRSGLTYGLENRRLLADRLTLITGAEVSLNIDVNDLYTDNAITLFGAGIGCVVGLQYEISDAFYVGLETIPAFNYRFSRAKNSRDTRNFHIVELGFNSNAVALTAVYRWAVQE